MPQEALAFRGRERAAATARQQHGAQPLLEPRDDPSQPGLRDAEAPRRRRHAAVFDYGQEVADLPQLDRRDSRRLPHLAYPAAGECCAASGRGALTYEVRSTSLRMRVASRKPIATAAVSMRKAPW